MAEVIVRSMLHLGAAAAGVVNPDQIKFQQYQNVNWYELDRLPYNSSPISSTSTHSPSSPAPNSPPAQTYALPSPPLSPNQQAPPPSRLALPHTALVRLPLNLRPLTHRDAALLQNPTRLQKSNPESALPPAPPH